jgi:hypothetical protein
LHNWLEIIATNPSLHLLQNIIIVQQDEERLTNRSVLHVSGVVDHHQPNLVKLIPALNSSYESSRKTDPREKQGWAESRVIHTRVFFCHRFALSCWTSLHICSYPFNVIVSRFCVNQEWVHAWIPLRRTQRTQQACTSVAPFPRYLNCIRTRNNLSKSCSADSFPDFCSHL